MTKLIFLCLLLCSNVFAQADDELSLESTTAPTVVEDAPDAPAEELIETPVLDSTESTEMTSATAAEEKNEVVVEGPEKVTSNPAPQDVQTPNPLETRSKAPTGLKEYVTGDVPYDAHKVDHDKGHWLTTFAFEGLKYNLPFAEFQGDRKGFKEKDQEIYGARLGFGRQFYMGAGFFTTSIVSIFYTGTLFTKNQLAEPEVEDEQVSSLKRTSGFYGGDISQQLGYIFNWKTKNPFMDEWASLTFEPFVEAGLGMGSSFNKVNYQFDSGVIDEQYKYTIEDKLTFAKAGGGFNLTAGNGFFMQAKVMVSTMDITERKTKGFSRNTAGTTQIFAPTTDKNAKMDSVTVFTLGGGYKF